MIRPENFEKEICPIQFTSLEETKIPPIQKYQHPGYKLDIPIMEDKI